MWESPSFKVAMGVCERPSGVRERPPPRPTAYDSRQPKLDFAYAPSEGPEHAAATSSSYGSAAAAAAAAAAGAAAASAAAAAAPLRSFTYTASPLPRTEPNSPRPPLQTLSPSPVASYVPPGILRGGAAETPTHHYAAAAFRGRAAAVRAGYAGPATVSFAAPAPAEPKPARAAGNDDDDEPLPSAAALPQPQPPSAPPQPSASASRQPQPQVANTHWSDAASALSEIQSACGITPARAQSQHVASLYAEVSAMREAAEARESVVADLRRQVSELSRFEQEASSLREQLKASELEREIARGARELALQATLDDVSSKLQLHETVEAQLEAQVTRLEEERLAMHRRLGEQLAAAEARAAAAEASAAEAADAMAASEAAGSSAFSLAVNARTREAEARAAMAVQSAQVLEMQLLEDLRKPLLSAC